MAGRGPGWRMVVLGLVLAFAAGALSPALADPVAVEDYQRQREQDLTLSNVMAEREQTLAAELLALDLLLDDLGKEQELIKEHLKDLRRQLEQARLDEAETRSMLKDARERLGRWLAVMYENGNVSLLALFLDARSIGDLMNRLELVGALIDHEAQLIRDVDTLRQTLERKLKAIDQIARKTREQQTLLESRIAEAKDAQSQKAAMMNALRAESGDLLARIVALEQEWFASLTPLHKLLGQLDRLFIKDMQPDRVYFADRRLCVEVSSSTINRVLAGLDAGEGTVLAVRLIPGGLTITGRSENSTSFSLSGRLVTDERGKQVRFVPTSLLLDGTPVQKAALAGIARGGSLFFELEGPYSRFAVDSITSDVDRLTIALVMR